ncbi:MAG: MMPL family transporter, partial [Planctomycetota bacterium]|nr:MMPL family transporter [Planctomycetota bacterium]
MSDSPTSWLDRFIDRQVRWRGACFLLAIALTAVALPFAFRLSFDQSIEALYPHDNPRLNDYRDSKCLFGGDELVLVAYRDPELYDPAADEFRNDRLNVVTRFSADLSKVEGVHPESTQDLAAIVGRAQSLRKIPKLGQIDRQARSLSRGILLGDDNQTTAVVLRLLPQSETKTSRGESIRQVRVIGDAFTKQTGLPVFVVGEPVQVHDMFRYVEEDGGRLGLWSSLLLLGVIFGMFRNLRWTLVPVAVVWVTIVWTRAILVAFDFRLSMVSSMLTSLVTIIGVATVIHVIVRYQELRPNRSPAEALRDALQQLAPAIFWTCATTAGGFGAQLSSHIHPVASFGLMMSLGTMLVLPALALLVPGGALIGGFAVDPKPAPGSRLVLRALTGLAHWVEYHPGQVWLSLLLLAGLTIVGCTRLTVETDFSRNFRANSPILKALDFVEGNLGGAGSWEINFPAPDVLDDDYLIKVRELATRLRDLKEGTGDQPALTKVMAITDGIDIIPRVPFFISGLAGQQKYLFQLQPEFIPSLYNPEHGRMRIILRSHERKRSEEKLKLIAQVEAAAQEIFPTDSEEIEPRATGLHVLLAFLTDSLLGDQWSSFLIAGGMIAAMMAVAYRSIRIGLLSLVPNLLAIGLVIAVMGWLNL